LPSCRPLPHLAIFSFRNMSRQFDLESIGRAYERWVPFYDLVFGSVFGAGRKATIQAAERLGGRVLDVGIGTGISLAEYSDGVRVVGVDYSESMLRKAQQRARVQNRSHVESLAVMDAQHLGFRNASFDAVVAQYVITAVPDPEATLVELARVTRPGGEIILVNHLSAAGGLQRSLENTVAPLAQRLGWSLDFDWPRLERWMRSYGKVRLVERRLMPPLRQFSMVRLERLGRTFHFV
jgi:phosphatidylethanolamine/phosphatidyl-N-methylethanolamine N-methyltransferase